MEFEEHDEQEDDIEIPVSPPAYDSLPNNSVPRSKISVSGGAAAGAEGGASAVTPGRKAEPGVTARYRECQKNHAVSLGAHAVDGCGEFIAAGEEGTLDALKCAACNCHRNFHRKETDSGDMTPHPQLPPPPHYQYHQQYPPYYRAPPPPAGYLHHHLTAQPMAMQRSLALPAPAPIRDEEDMSNPSSSGGGGSGGGGGKKRCRTKFTQEQKEKMLAFAERVGWRIQKHDEAAVEQFCAETCVKRHVLKVWMHNNKNTLVYYISIPMDRRPCPCMVLR
ncbi:zinc-finger homeodomain protein 2 isoform X2 [Neltuma alba]|uniref:zinc-finger homeodomain protein 2 isoform X2 n=1 Tax=Neltuma alba TaxID=207710 RepID=UPI0010A3558C|nr:zinc-finger homeodomain protein 2-like isoform X2 [Prosopis alba]